MFMYIQLDEIPWISNLTLYLKYMNVFKNIVYFYQFDYWIIIITILIQTLF